jgi:SEC-C motif domain protein
MTKIHSCPCGTGLALSDCCGRYWAGAALAPTAEALMRSRYSAYALGKVDYLIETHHPSQRQRGEKLQLQRSLQQTRWVHLQVLEAAEGLGGEDRAEVEFVAVYRLAHSVGHGFAGLLAGGAGKGTDQPLAQMHERSRFVREAGRWFYVDGDQLPDYKPQGNQSCWCGSGQKFKHCHG